MKQLIAVGILAAMLGGCALNPAKLIGGDKKEPAKAEPRKETPAFWRKDGKEGAKLAQKPQTDRRKAKNLILFVGDGMSLSTITAARILVGQNAASEYGGTEAQLSFETFPATALAKTYNVDLQTAQAGGSMTALVTGLKTRGASVGLDQIPTEGQCREAFPHQEPTILEQAKSAGMAAGLVTTARVTAAAAAATYAHISNPNWEVDANLSPAAVSEGCEDIAKQLTTFDQQGPLDVVFGGGRIAFMPRGKPDPGTSRFGVRSGPVDLIEDWQQREPGRTYVRGGGGITGKAAKTLRAPVLGLFSPDHMLFEAERQGAHSDEPSLTDMTKAAIAVLERNKNGYVLVVVAAGIGRAHDETRAGQALWDTVELSKAVDAAREATSDKDTLIVVTATRGSTLTLGGAASRTSQILAVAANDKGEPIQVETPSRDRTYAYTGLSYGFGPQDAERRDPPQTNNAWPAALAYQQPSAIPLPTAVGGGEDVPVYALGPGSQWFHGTLEQHALYWLMREATPTLERGHPVRKVAGVPVPDVGKLVPKPFNKTEKKKKQAQEQADAEAKAEAAVLDVAKAAQARTAAEAKAKAAGSKAPAAEPEVKEAEAKLKEAEAKAKEADAKLKAAEAKAKK